MKPRMSNKNQGQERKSEEWKLKGPSEHIKKLKQEITYVARKIQKHDFAVLIEGPSGTGKELIAKAISERSGRKSFTPINCASLPGTLFESELFGYKKGAFTGATQDKAGLVEGAEGGILFLDEIGDLAPEHQGKILRLLQNKSYNRVGDNQERNIKDIRFIAATNKDLGKAIKEGEFREDLYYRLNHRVIRTIPLKDRRVDLIYLLHDIRREKNLKIDHIDHKAKALLYSYDFPGNVRELQSLIYSADDYQYIRETLAQGVYKQSGQNLKSMLGDSHKTDNFIKKINRFDFQKYLSTLDEQSKISVAFLNAIKEIDQNDHNWELETKRYEILMLWGITDLSKEDICRVMGIRADSLSPDKFKAKFNLALPDRTEIQAQMQGFETLRLYPEFLMKFPWPAFL